MEIIIRNRFYNDKIIVSGEYESIKQCLEQNRDISFYEAQLGNLERGHDGIDLQNGQLNDMNFFAAILNGADFRGANLRNTNLAFAFLIGAKLEGADLQGANLFHSFVTRSEFNKAITNNCKIGKINWY